jgi:hypothetical protein
VLSDPPDKARTCILVAGEGIVLKGKAKLVLGLAALAVVAIAGWQIGSCEIANLELQTDLRDISIQLASRIGMEAPNSDQDLRNAVIHKAEEHGIHLEPRQVTVQHVGGGKTEIIYVAADYNVFVKLPGYSFSLHFTPSSTK